MGGKPPRSPRPKWTRSSPPYTLRATECSIPPENARLLHESLGRPEIRWLAANHYSMALRIHEVLARTDRHLDRIFR